VGLHETHIHMNITTVRVTLLTREEEMLGLARLLSSSSTLTLTSEKALNEELKLHIVPKASASDSSRKLCCKSCVFAVAMIHPEASFAPYYMVNDAYKHEKCQTYI